MTRTTSSKTYRLLFWIVYGAALTVAVLDFGLVSMMALHGTLPGGTFSRISIGLRLILLALAPFVGRMPAYGLIGIYGVLFLDFLNRGIQS